MAAPESSVSLPLTTAAPPLSVQAAAPFSNEPPGTSLYSDESPHCANGRVSVELSHAVVLINAADGAAGTAPGWGWAAYLLPYIEQQSLHHQLDFNQPAQVCPSGERLPWGVRCRRGR